MRVNLFKSVREAYIHPNNIIECNFNGLVDVLTQAQKELTNKTDIELFNVCSWKLDYEKPPRYKSSNLIRRCKSNVENIYCLLLDVDGTMTLEQAITEWSQYEFVIYSTYSNSVEKEKFRLVVPLKTPMSLYEFDSRHDAMCKQFNVDGASFTISQCFYLPSYNKDNKHLAFIHHNKVDKRFEALNIKAIELNNNVLSDFSPPEVITPMGKCVYSTLLTGSDLHYADVLSLATVCKSYGISANDFKNIVNTIADSSSDLRTKKVNLQELYKKGYNTHVTNKTAINLMKKLNCNIWRFKE